MCGGAWRASGVRDESVHSLVKKLIDGHNPLRGPNEAPDTTRPTDGRDDDGHDRARLERSRLVEPSS